MTRKRDSVTACAALLEAVMGRSLQIVRGRMQLVENYSRFVLLSSPARPSRLFRFAHTVCTLIMGFCRQKYDCFA